MVQSELQSHFNNVVQHCPLEERLQKCMCLNRATSPAFMMTRWFKKQQTRFVSTNSPKSPHFIHLMNTDCTFCHNEHASTLEQISREVSLDSVSTRLKARETTGSQRRWVSQSVTRVLTLWPHIYNVYAHNFMWDYVVTLQGNMVNLYS